MIGKFTKSFILFAFIVLITACSEKPLGKDIHGNTINLSDYQGKWVVLNYWASWCQPCYKEFPELNAFYKAHKNSTAVVLGVNFDNMSNQNLLKFVKQQGIDYPMLSSDPGFALGIMNIKALPATFLISPKGKIVGELFGPKTKSELEYAMNLPSATPILELKNNQLEKN